MEPNDIIQPQEPAKKSPLKKLFKIFFWFVFVIVFLLGTSVVLVFVYEDDVKGIIITELNKNLNAEIRIDPKNIDLTIIKTFPDCALEFKDVTCMEAIKSDKRDTLLFARSLQLKFDVKDLWNKKYDINKIKLQEAFCRLKINSKGKPNYIVWKESESDSISNDSLKFSLELIEFVNVKASYTDAKNKFRTDLLLNEVSFTGKFDQTDYDLQSEGNILVNKIRSHKVDLLKNKNINYKASLQVSGNNYQIKVCEVQLNKMYIETSGNMVYADSLNDLNLNFKGKNLDIRSVLSLLPDEYKNKINDYTSEGNFYASGNLKYHQTVDLDVEFGVTKTTIIYEPKKATLQNLNAVGKYSLSKNNSSLELRNVSGDLMNDHFEGNMVLSNLNDPFLDLDLKGKLNLANVIQFWPIDTLSTLRGAISFQTRIKSNVEALKKNVLSENAVFDLTASLSDLMIQFKGQKDSTNIRTCELKAVDRSLEVTNLGIKKGRSDLLIDGKVQGAYSYILDSKSALKIYGNLKSNNIAIEDFLFGGNSSSEAKTEIDVPDNINFILDASIENLTFGKFSATKLAGNIELKNKKILADNVSLKAMDGSAVIDALMDLNGKLVDVSLHTELTSINVSKLFTQLNNFNQQTLVDNNIGGALTATIDFSGNWNKFLEPDLNSMKSVSDLKIEQGKLVDFKPLESLSKFVDINDLKSIKFSSLQSHIEISKGVITIPKTAIKNSALNIDLWGTHSFNNDIDYHVQLLISDLLAKKRKGSTDEEFGLVENDPENHRSAFILMTGNVDNPIIKYDRKGLKQKIKEDIKQEKQNLKQILKEEFGVFKKDSIKAKENKKADQTFKIDNSTKKQEPKKKEEDDDDF